MYTLSPTLVKLMHFKCKIIQQEVFQHAKAPLLKTVTKRAHLLNLFYPLSLITLFFCCRTCKSHFTSLGKAFVRGKILNSKPSS